LRVLAFDLTGDRGSIALLDQGGIDEVALEAADGFAHAIFGDVEKLLTKHGVTLQDIDVFASASGPGSFTGVRVGLTAAKGLAEAVGAKVVAVSNLKALAAFGTGELRAVLIDARRGEIFGAVYNSQLELVQNEVVMKEDAWRATLPADAEVITAASPLAAAIAKIAAQRFKAGLAQDPAEIDANYVRRSDAELFWKDR
jgi:tRNA threonylcarbamoyladenosine biosynthesis protein TsaB